MWAQVFKQAFEVTAWNPLRKVFIPLPLLEEREYITLPCLDCGGSGKVLIPDVPESMRGVIFEPGEAPYKAVTCNCCKGSGDEYINLC